jgi:hypothetical protein
MNNVRATSPCGDWSNVRAYVLTCKVSDQRTKKHGPGKYRQIGSQALPCPGYNSDREINPGAKLVPGDIKNTGRAKTLDMFMVSSTPPSTGAARADVLSVPQWCDLLPCVTQWRRKNLKRSVDLKVGVKIKARLDRSSVHARRQLRKKLD